MTPKEIIEKKRREAIAEYNQMKPHDLRDRLDDAIDRMIRGMIGHVLVNYHFVIQGEERLNQVVKVESPLERDLVFAQLDYLREKLESEGTDYKLEYSVAYVRGGDEKE
jgi:hypothetical protein